MKIITYNINGIRAAMRKGFHDWVKAAQPDVLCLQEVKAEREQADLTPFEEMGYHIHWHSAQKKGYSGVATLSLMKPKKVTIGCGEELYDTEGRVLQTDFEDFSVINVYMPSGTTGDERQSFKMGWLNFFYDYASQVKEKVGPLLIGGDFNICHKPIDIHNPVANKNTSGFKPEERAWVTHFLKSGFIDTFRVFNQEPHQYSWWSYRANARSKNLGWRIDYIMASADMNDRLSRSVILKEAVHSDHCPVLLQID